MDMYIDELFECLTVVQKVNELKFASEWYAYEKNEQKNKPQEKLKLKDSKGNSISQTPINVDVQEQEREEILMEKYEQMYKGFK